MHNNPTKGNSLPLVDAVFLERETSPLGESIDHVLGILSDPDFVVSQEMILDLIALRWIACDVLRGQGYSLETISRMDSDPTMQVRIGE